MCAVWLKFPLQFLALCRFPRPAAMDLRPRVARWHHGRGSFRSLATASTSLTRSSSSSTGPGVIVGRTVAGAPSPQVPTRDTPGTSSSSLGSIGSPASNGTNPRLTRPAAVDCWLQAGFADCNSLGVESGTMTVYNNNSRAPAGVAGPPSTNSVSCAQCVGGDGPPPAGELGPTSLLLRKAQPSPTAGITSMRDRARFRWSGRGEICQWCGGSEAQQMAVAAWARVDDAHLTSSGPSP